jgi:hypothetical protein
MELVAIEHLDDAAVLIHPNGPETALDTPINVFKVRMDLAVSLDVVFHASDLRGVRVVTGLLYLTFVLRTQILVYHAKKSTMAVYKRVSDNHDSGS